MHHGGTRKGARSSLRRSRSTRLPKYSVACLTTIERVPEEAITLVSDRVLSELENLTGIEMHELLCCLRLLHPTKMPREYRDQLHAKLNEPIKSAVVCDAERWKGYNLRPLQVVHSPESPFMAGLEKAVTANLDYEIASQNSDGSWTPTWSWDDTFPEEWAKAKVEWSGVITLEKLLTLKRFGRIEGVA